MKHGARAERDSNKYTEAGPWAFPGVRSRRHILEFVGAGYPDLAASGSIPLE